MREVSRLYLKDTNSDRVSKFINIVAINKNKQFHQYKITFEGLASVGNWTFIREAAVDSVKGFRKLGKSHPLRGTMSVGYHADGNIMYKAENKNFRPKKHLPISQIKSPEIFLSVIGFSLAELSHLTTAGLKENESLLPIKVSQADEKLACNIYISKGRRHVNFTVEDPGYLKNSQSISLYDDVQDMSFHLHFYRTHHQKGIVVTIRPKLGPVGRIRQNILYHYYEWRDYLLSIYLGLHKN